jgi:glyoxylase-like metal-dependent hydrolase (beta-lactamase superfamily II)
VPHVTRLDDGLHCIDVDFQGRPGVIASYLIEDSGERALVDTGPTSTLDTLLRALGEMDVDPNSITKLFATHIHLDHSGAAGTFIKRFPGAHLYVHEIGAPHMIDPSRLLASATRIYGDMMGPLWGEVEPVPEDSLTRLTEGDTVTVGNRRLEVLYTPGHASHHVAYYEEERAAVFTGDVAAVRLQGFDYVRPPTPPPDLDLDLWSQSLERIAGLDPRTIYLAHFGPFMDVQRHLREAKERLYAWADLIEAALQRDQDRPAIVDTVRLREDGELLERTDEALVLERYELAAPYGMSVDGYLRYFRKRG